MSEIKTPAQLKAEQVKAEQAEKNGVADNAKDPKGNADGDLKNQLEEANRLRKEAEKKALALEKENSKLAKEINKTNGNNTITSETLKNVDEKETKSLDHDFFTITVTNKSLTYSGFRFEKGEKYAITGRNTKVIKELVERKLGKIVKS